MTSNVDGAGHDRVSRLLAEYVAGSAHPGERALVDAHLACCASCRSELASWRAVRRDVRAVAPIAVAPDRSVVAKVLARAAAGAGSVSSPGALWYAGQAASRTPVRAGGVIGLRHAWAVLVGQLPVVRRRLWLASALVMLMGSGVAAAGTSESAGLVLALVAPVVAAAGLAVVYGTDVDPGLELAAATPTPARVVLLARLAVVFGYDLLLALAASGALLGFGVAGDLWALVGAWLGPMALLSAVSLLVSVRFGPNVAMAAAMAVWAAQLLASRATELATPAVARFASHLWATNGVTLALAAALVATAVLVAPRTSLRKAV